MESTTDFRSLNFLKIYAKTASIIVLGIGLLVLFAWFLNLPLLKSLLPNAAAMKFNTALCFALSGISLFFLQNESASPKQKRIGQIVAVIVLLTSLLTLVEYLFGWNFGIDQFFIRDLETPPNAFPGRMSQVSAICFALCCLALLWMEAEVSQYFSLGAFILSLLAINGYIFSHHTLSEITSFKTAAMLTAFTFLILSLAILFSRPSHTIIKTLAPNQAGSKATVFFLPLSIFLILALAWLVEQGESAGLLDSSDESVVLVTALILSFSPIIVFFIQRMNRAAEKLRRGEEVLRLFVEHSPAAIAMFDRDMKYIAASRRYLNDYGLGGQNLMGRSHYEVFPEIPERWKEIHRRCLAGDTERIDEDSFPRADDHLEWISWEIRPWHEANGEIGGIILFSEVITERKRADEALRASEEKYSVLFDESPFALALTKMPENVIVGVNDAFLELFEFTRAKALGKTSVELGIADEESRAKVGAEFQALGRVQDFEVFRKTRSGERLDLALNLNWVTIGREKYILTTIRDITARKRAEETLRIQNLRLKTLREIDLAILAADSIEEITRAALDHIRGLIDCRRISLHLIDWQANESLIFDQRTTEATVLPKGSRIPLAPLQVLIQPLLQNQPGVINDLTAQADSQPILQTMLKEGLHSLCSLPLYAHGNLFGMLSLFSETQGFFDEDKVNLAREVANQVAIAITQSRLTEALRQSEEKFSTLFEKAPYIVGLATLPNGVIADVNEAFEKTLGFTKREAQGRTLLELGIFPHAEERARIIAQQKEHGFVHDLELILYTKSGEPRWMSMNIDQVNIGGQAYVLNVAEDITKRKQAEEAQRESEEQFRATFDQAAVGIAHVSPDGRWLKANQKLCDIVGYSREELFSKAFQDITHPDDLDNDLEYVKQILADKIKTYSMEKRYFRKDGSTVWIDLTVSLVRDVHGEPKYFISVVEDITKRKQAEMEIVRRLQNIQALQKIDQAIAGSLDLKLTLKVVLEQTKNELNVDAAAVLLLNPHTQLLEFAAGLGFFNIAIKSSRLHLGEGHGGRAALERRTISVTNLPGSDQLQFVRAALLADEGFATYFVTPLIAKGRVRGVLEVFHRTAFVPDQDWLDFLEVLAGQAAIAVDSASLFTELQHANTELFNAYDSTIEGWSHALDLRDKETEGHTQRVTEMTMQLARAAGITEAELVHVRRGALLHDIGKMGVPDHILHKPDKLTDEEWVAMRKHPTFALELLSPIAYLRSALDIPYCHHEKWDGSGYPRGLKGEQIPLAARLFAIVDVYDALRSDRPYRQGWSKEKVIGHIKSLSGTHFEPKAVELFLNMMHK